ncbi:T9SS type A sorting domain-containing protein [Marinoscillum luteum]|uniref:T9SS type A sorting domain-containing protein n=1 Tax=Marinoscillum luteum TaxID=861051 RepID=A0ABW7ND65_9BACT
MKKTLTKLFRQNLKALMLVMMTSFFAFSATGQYIQDAPDPGVTHYVGQDTTVNVDASGYNGGDTTLWLVYNWDGTLEENYVLGSVVTGSTKSDIDIDFAWPETGNVELTVVITVGSTFEDDLETLYASNYTYTGGAVDGGLSFYRAGARSYTSTSVDLDTDEPVYMSVYLGVASVGEDNYVRVRYSTDGGTNYSTLLNDSDSSNFYGGNGWVDFTLPEAAKSPATIIKISQVGSDTLGTNELSWEMFFDDGNVAEFNIGDAYDDIDGETGSNYFINSYTLEIDDLLNENVSVLEGSVYPGDELVLSGTLYGGTVSDYNYALVVDGVVISETPSDTDDGLGLVEFTFDAPVDMAYNENLWFEIVPYALADASYNAGFEFDADFVAELNEEEPDEEETVIVGGEDDGSDAYFYEAGERSATTQALNLAGLLDPKMGFQLARLNDEPSPAGTDIVFEYSTDDGATYTEIGSFVLNDLPFKDDYSETFYFYGTDNEEADFDFPSAVLVDGVIFRFRQESNIGDNEDSWYLNAFYMDSGDNRADEIDYDESYFSLNEPVISLSPLNISETVPYPMTELTLDWTIDAGEFPANTGAKLYLDGDIAGGYDILVGEVADVTLGTMDFTVPPLEAGDYEMYLMVNGVDYGTVYLPIYDLGISITGISYDPSVSIGGEEYAVIGSAITVEYDISGEPGEDAELTIAVWDYDEEEYVTIGMSSDFTGSITATLPTDINLDDDGESDPYVQIGVTAGIFSLGFDETVYDLYTQGSYLSNIYDNDGNNVFDSWSGTLYWYNPDDFVGSGERYAVSSILDTYRGGESGLQGGEITVTLRSLPSYNGSFTVSLEVSTDGEEWEWVDDVTFSGGNQNMDLEYLIEEEYFSETFQYRVIYDYCCYGSYSYGSKIYNVEFVRPEYLEVIGDESEFNFRRPLLTVADLEDKYIQIGEEVTINYNAQFFPEDVEFALKFQAQGNYIVLATSDTHGAGSFTVNIPYDLEETLDPPHVEWDNYSFKVDAFIPETPGGAYSDGSYIELEDEEDFIAVEGTDDTEPSFTFNQSGERSLLTRAIDLTVASNPTLTFYWDDAFDANSTKSLVPRLEASIDGGVTFTAVQVYELAEDEEQMFDDGLIYHSGTYDIEIPAELITEATHFRWSQPLNLGSGSNVWNIDDIEIEFDDANKYTGYDKDNKIEDIEIYFPDLDGYSFDQADPDVAIFNGSTFEFAFGPYLDKTEEEIEEEELTWDEFPEGTQFNFYIDVFDPTTDDDLMIASFTAGTTSGEVEIPYYVTNGNYDVYVDVYYEVGNEAETVLWFEENTWIGDFDVFNRAIQLQSDADQGTILYAGSTVTFSIEVENETSALNTDNLYANLIYNDDLLLMSQQGLGDITIDLPSFIGQSEAAIVVIEDKFEIQITEGGPLGEDLSELEDNELGSLNEDVSNFINTAYAVIDDGDFYSDHAGDYDVIQLIDAPNRKLTTRDFEAGELENTSLLIINTYFDVDGDDLFESQYMIFEYSIDGGATYTSLDTLKDYVNEELKYSVTDEMKSNDVRFRWRQSENEGLFVINDISFTYAKVLPFDYSDLTLDIKPQALIVTSVDQEETGSCFASDITINYEIRGRFGADNLLKAYYDGGGSHGYLEGYEFPATEGTGSVTVQVAAALIDADQFDGVQKNNSDFKFKLYADDDTFEDLGKDFESESVYSDEVEIVAPIEKGTSAGMYSGGNVSECDPEAFVYLYDPQMYFLYEVLNADTVFASLEYDDESGSTIELGDLTEAVDLSLRVTSRTSTGSVCNVHTFNSSIEINITPNDVLLRDRYTTSGTIEVTEGETKTICSGDDETVVLSLANYDADDSEVEWFRDNFDNPVEADGDDFDNFEVSGAYFARITEGECSYVTIAMNVTVLEKAETPEITVVSNDISCGDGTAVLSAPEGFAHYLWSNGEITQSITVDEADSYSVRVSNYPIVSTSDAYGCASSSSESVVIENNNFEQVYLSTFYYNEYSSSSYADNYIEDGETLTNCGDDVIYVFVEDDNNYYGGQISGILTLYKDGAVYDVKNGDVAGTNGYTNNNFEITESGEYYVEWSGVEVENACTSVSETFTMTINEAVEERPVITASGDISFCEGGSVTLSAPAGYPFYRWYNSGTVVGNGETLEVADDGSYRVRVSNVAFGNGCGSDYSEYTYVTVYETEDDLMLGYYNGGGNYEDGDEIEVCSSDNFTLWVNNESTSGATYTWYRDGVAIPNANSTSRVVKASGTFHAEVTYGVDDIELAAPCVYTTPSVVVNFNQKPAAVRIAEPTNVDFCAGEINLTLTADAGAAFYNWYHNGSPMFDEPSTSNTLLINDGGTYSVTVETGDIGCESARSNIITIDERAKANPNINVYTDGSDCATGDVTVYLSSTNSSTVYQLINRETGAEIGSPVVGSSGTNVYTTLSGLTEPVALLVEASYTDGSGCSDVSSSARGTATPNAVILELDGTEITAEVSSTGGYEVSWYRNGTLMRNATGNTINVVDAATYSVEVTFDDGCTITSSTVDVGAGAPAAGRSASNGRIVANTFPNPSADFVNVEVPGEHFGVYQVQIMTLSGQVVISGEFTKDQESYVERIDISDLENGIYNMMVVKGKQVENIRIVKK